MPLDQKKTDFYQLVRQFCERPRGTPPIIIGLNAPQGAGKTTLSNFLVEAWQNQGTPATAISIDDFYLTNQQQKALRARHAGNALLAERGYPGTHDIELGVSVLQKLTECDPALIPRYDKSAFSGAGDRTPEAEWTKISGPLRYIILEGWMLGFQPQPQQSINDVNLRTVNEKLKNYEAWTRFCDAFIYLKPKKVDYVVNWRVEAEQNQRASGKAGMSDAKARAYVEQFLPAYQLYRESIGAKALNLSDADYLKIDIEADRLPVDPDSC